MNIPKNLEPEQFRNYFEENYKDLTLLDEYISGSEKVSIQCTIDDLS
jgi:ribosomal protein S18